MGDGGGGTLPPDHLPAEPFPSANSLISFKLEQAPALFRLPSSPGNGSPVALPEPAGPHTYQQIRLPAASEDQQSGFQRDAPGDRTGSESAPHPRQSGMFFRRLSSTALSPARDIRVLLWSVDAL